MAQATCVPRRTWQANPPGRFKANSEVRAETALRGGSVHDFMMPRKSAKESPTQPYPKPTQVDEVNIQRRLREHSLRN